FWTYEPSLVATFCTLSERWASILCSRDGATGQNSEGPRVGLLHDTTTQHYKEACDTPVFLCKEVCNVDKAA
ncbi:hypothetical protein HAX54_049032, partial [Datura stramonium]|nr:hypothetical protein [Datura stramonium]